MQFALRGTQNIFGQACHRPGLSLCRVSQRTASGALRASRHYARATGNKSGGVLDRPTVTPGIDRSSETKKKKPPMYRVMLHNDNTNRREYVVKVLMKIVDGLTVDDAINVMNLCGNGSSKFVLLGPGHHIMEAHTNGLACVVACAQVDAERYCEGLRNNGLIASIEPCSSKS